MILQNFLDLLELNKFLEIVAQHAKSDASKNAVLSIKPLSSRDAIEKRFSLVTEIRRMSQNGRPLGILPFADIASLLQKARPEDAILESLELVAVMDFLHAIHEASIQIKKDILLVSLNELIGDVADRGDLLHSLNSSVDREGNILDSASFRLAELRSEKRRLEARIRKRLEEIIRDEKTAIFLQDDFITQRSGRWVIPVRMDSKGQVPGVAHDVSRTGETAFVEPISIISLSNEYENIIAEEKAEVMRVLRELGAQIRKNADALEYEFKTLVSLDMLRCIAAIAEEFRMQIPGINKENILRLEKAKHPLLLHAARQRNRAGEIIPIDVRLGGDKTVMVITGPNAGGKTVTLKTVGLLSIMALSGMPIPADASTTIPLFESLLVDIGDRQSLADNLSTFTAHLSNMMEFLTKADPATLILIDELGTGTDPEEGAALSCAILRKLKERGCLIFATTHLTDVKVFAHKEDAMINASMEFDRKTFMPLYKLRMGEPGQSFALETARRYGLSEEIIETAGGMLGKRRADLENLIHDLDQKRRYYEDAMEGVKRQSEELKEREERLAAFLDDAEKRKKEMLADAHREASEIIIDAKRKMLDFLDEIKKRGKAKEILKEVALQHEKTVEKMREYEAVETEPLSIDELREGDRVFVKSLGYDAAIVKLFKKKSRMRVKAGAWEMEVPLSDVGARKGRGIGEGKGEVKASIAEESAEQRLNIIGLRVDEALSRLERFLNDATLAGLSEVAIIHGVGMGILAKAVQEHLSEHPLVKSFRSGEQSEGGGGVTVVSLK